MPICTRSTTASTLTSDTRPALSDRDPCQPLPRDVVYSGGAMAETHVSY
jgi:hypothetical protein